MSSTTSISGTDDPPHPSAASQLTWPDPTSLSASSTGVVYASKPRAETTAANLESNIDPIQKAIYENTFNRRPAKKVVAFRTCEICNIDLTGQAVIDAHYAGNKHAKKVKAQELLSNLVGAAHVVIPSQSRMAPFRCEVCQVTLNSLQQLDLHYSVCHPGTKHMANMSKTVDHLCSDETESNCAVNNSQNSTSCDIPSTHQLEIQSPDLCCTLCNIVVNSPQQLEQHLGSKKHIERETGRRQPRSGPYYRPAGRGNRGGLGSRGHPGVKASHFTSLSSSFKSGGYTNSFIKEQGGVIMPKNLSGSSQSHSFDRNLDQGEQKPESEPKPNSRFTMQSRKGNFGSLAPYVNNNEPNTHNKGWDYGNWTSAYGYYGFRPAGVRGGMNNMRQNNANNYEGGYNNDCGTQS